MQSTNKTFKYFIIYFITIFLLAACGSSNSGGNSATPPPPVVVVPDPVSTVSLRVSTPAGDELQGINVEATSSTTMETASTDTNGLVSFELTPEGSYTLLLTANDYANQVVNITSPTEGGAVNLEVTMLARSSTQSFDAATGGLLSGIDGANVTLPANAFLDANGNSISGNIDLSITPVDVSNKAILESFPGEFTGIQADGTETPIISFGTTEYHFSLNGEEVQLADGMTASIEMPIYIDTYEDGTNIKIGDQIPLWSLNEDTGIWEQEGDGTVVINKDSPTGFSLQASVSHFSWWNIDIPFASTTSQVEITVLGSKTGTAVIKLFTDKDIGWLSPIRRIPISVGGTTNPISLPANDEMCFYADVFFSDSAYGVSNTECVTPLAGTITAFDLLVPTDGALDIVANSELGQVSINENTGFPINKIKLQALTSESSVIYTVKNGTLPQGLSLRPSYNTKAEITGTPTQDGTYMIEVEGNNGTETDVVSITFNITTASSVELLDPITINQDVIEFQAFDIDLNATNLGSSPIVHWELLDESGIIPSWLDLNATSGNLTILAGSITDSRNWSGFLRARNSVGNVGITSISINLLVFEMCAFMPDDPLCQGG